MLQISGVGIIDPEKEIKETNTSNNQYFFLSFVLRNKDDTKGEYHYHNVTVSVPAEHLEKARRILQLGSLIQIYTGSLISTEKEYNGKKYIKPIVRVSFSNIKLLRKPQ